MKLKDCDYCNGSRHDPAEHNSYFPIICVVCEGTGEIPAEPVSHCQACGETVELGREWCQRHQPAADLWQALNDEQLQKIANDCIAIAEPTVHLDADGNEIPWCYDHDERVITDGYCFTCLTEQNQHNQPS